MIWGKEGWATEILERHIKGKNETFHFNNTIWPENEVTKSPPSSDEQMHLK